MPLPNHLTGSRQPPAGSSSSSYPDQHHHATSATTSITRQPNKTIYNVYSNKKSKEQKPGEAEVEVMASIMSPYGGQRSRNIMQHNERPSRGYRSTTRAPASSQSPSSSRYGTNSRTRSATPARANALMSRSAGTGCPPPTTTPTWIPSGGRFNTSPRTYYSKARTQEAERQAAIASAAMAASSPPSTLSTKNTSTQSTPTNGQMTLSQKSSTTRTGTSGLKRPSEHPDHSKSVSAKQSGNSASLTSSFGNPVSLTSSFDNGTLTNSTLSLQVKQVRITGFTLHSLSLSP